MTIADPFKHDDAAHGLDALSEPERETFEAHLATCIACTTRVNNLAATSTLLADMAADDLPLELLRRPGRAVVRVHATAALIEQKWGTQFDLDTIFTSGTALRRDQIGSIQITRPNGTPILQLTT